MIVRVIRQRNAIKVFDSGGAHLMTLPADHQIVARMNGSTQAQFQAEWKSGSLEIGDRR